MIRSVEMTRIVSVTKKGQATIPKVLREKFGVGDKVLVEETEEGILLMPLPRPRDDYGSLREIFRGKTAREILDEARKEDLTRERRMVEGVSQ